MCLDPLSLSDLTPPHVQAKTALVAAYKILRTEDAAPGSSTAYRITVRQLEALVRLSEALARLRCRNTILPTDVNEVPLQQLWAWQQSCL